MRNIKKEYKALIVDVDGTVVTHDFGSLPSKKLVAAVARAQEKIFVGIATARPYHDAKHIIEYMGLTGPCIVNNGAQIIDALTGRTLYEQMMIDADVEAVCRVASDLKFSLVLNAKERNVTVKELDRFAGQIYGACTVPVIDDELADLFIDQISDISTVSAAKTPSHASGKSWVVLGHAKGTKLHGVLEVSKFLNIKTDDIIGAGDGDNDFPLLMACGLRVAMGNAIEGLKDIADYVAPSVTDDGLVDVINRFVFNLS